MNKRGAKRNKKRKYPGKDITFGKMWLAVPLIRPPETGMDITNQRESDNDE